MPGPVGHVVDELFGTRRGGPGGPPRAWAAQQRHRGRSRVAGLAPAATTASGSEDAIAFRSRARATHAGPLLGHPPTGRRIDLEAASFATVRNGLIVEAVAVADPNALAEQLGIDLRAPAS